VQAELGRYVLATGDTYMRALGRLPGKISGPRGPVAWPIWLIVLPYPFAVLAMGGILGGAGQAAALLIPGLDSTLAAGLLAVLTLLMLAAGTYASFERLMLVLVIAFTATTLVCSIAMQFTEYQLTAADLRNGFRFDFPMEFLALALAVYGYTGVNAGETSAYTYWCVEKGYPGFIGADRDDPAWLARARGWIKVVQTDVWATLLILTCATLPFYVLGAGVLNALGERLADKYQLRVIDITSEIGTGVAPAAILRRIDNLTRALDQCS